MIGLLQALGLVRRRDEELYYSLGQAVSVLRWLTIGMMLLLTAVQPRMGRVGLMNWELVLLFAGYNMLSEALLGRLSSKRFLTWRVVVDLPAASIVYFCSATPGAPQFDLIFLAVLCAAISLSLPRSLVYAVFAVGVTAIIEPTLPFWIPTTDQVRELGSRMLLLALVGTGTAIISRRLTIEQEESRLARSEAERLEKSSRMRDDFISSVTHDLRTPFTAIRAGLGMVEMSLEDRLHPEEQHLMANVRRNSDRLGILINDLLAFTQFEAGALHLDPQPVDLRDVANSAASALHPLISEKRQNIEVILPVEMPHKGDRRRLEQVIVNLIDNAHRHTPPGTRITVTGQTTPNEVCVVIRDDGPGIPPLEREAIFERFHRVDIAEGGWGLGLTIAQAITEKHGGRIWVESQLGQGCAFHVALPRYEHVLYEGED